MDKEKDIMTVSEADLALVAKAEEAAYLAVAEKELMAMVALAAAVARAENLAAPDAREAALAAAQTMAALKAANRELADARALEAWATEQK